MEERTKLIQARKRHKWTREEAAEYLEIDDNTLYKWEKGLSSPRAHNIERLCEVYGGSAWELGITTQDTLTEETHAVSSDVLSILCKEDMTLRLFALVIGQRHTSPRALQRLQAAIIGILEELETMHTENQNYYINRREALCRLASLPLISLHLSAFEAVMTHPIEDILTQCAAGITACGYLSKQGHEEITLALSSLAAYLPTLKAIVKESSQHRKAASRLTAQGLLTLATLSLHRDGPKKAITYGLQAVTYSKESGDPSLRLAIMRRLAWMYACDQQPFQALDTVNEAQYLLQHSATPVAPSVQSSIYGGLAKYRAQSGTGGDIHEDIDRSHALFSLPENNDEDTSYAEYDQSNLLMNEGLANYYQGNYDQSFHVFSSVIDPSTLSSHIYVSSERTRVEIVNYQTLASLKLPKAKKDKELSLRLWKAGMQGAKALQSEQRYSEASRAYDIIEALWGESPEVKDLRDLKKHW